MNDHFQDAIKYADQAEKWAKVAVISSVIALVLWAISIPLSIWTN